MQERSYLKAMLQGKCPHCREGNIFATSAADLKHFNQMNATCPHCGIRLEPEPGFYQGAMYVSYAFTIVALVMISAILYYAGNPSEWVYIGVFIGVVILMVPLNYRYSRILFLYLFGGIKYDPHLSR